LSIAWSDERKGSLDVFLATTGVAAAVGSESGLRIVWRAAPNPFRHWVGIEPAGGERSAAEGLTGFDVVDIQGRRVREVSASGLPLGWDGRDDRGNQVAAGTYFLRFPGGDELRVTRLR
jgi:hypothetical protein